ncbi:MAG: efflux RND transporter permease subunit [Candidatus Gracilibacteria bacterium]|nr:efflux RND transporter permease subunit [Candidatus Gracilibacteria bacterium]MDD2908695.1 efflux RND transporter permease subunit [Candidatus Gracilibacteria bacterium]
MSENNHKIKSKYLDKLKFDPKLNDSWSNFFLTRTRFIILLVVIIVIAGLLSARTLPLESNPEVKIGIGTVVTMLPGASPEIVEDLVTKKLEKQINKIKGIDTMTSTSKNSVSMIIVQFTSNKDIPTAMRELKDKADLAKKDLPADTKDPVVTEISLDDSPIWTFTISGEYNGFELYDYAKKIRDELEKNPLVSEARLSGGDQVEFRVEYDPKKLDELNLTASSVNSAIAGLNFTIPIGDLAVDKYKHTITLDERFFDIQSLKNLVISKTGNSGIIYLKDVANVFEAPKKRTTLSRLSYKGSDSKLTEPSSAVTLGVVKKTGGSIVNLIDEGVVKLEEMQSLGILPKDLKITTIQDNSERIKLDLEHLVRDGLITVLLVFLSLFAIIGIKEALVAGISAPLVFLMTFTIMALFGQTLNFLTMFALILSLGLLVDDAIVVISAINQYKGTGKFTTRESALLVLRDYRNVLISTTLTVVYIFSAMLFMTGIMGKFLFSIPFIITVTLLSSLIVALTINPALAVTFDKVALKKGQKESRLSKFMGSGFIKLTKIENFYEHILEYIISKRKRAITFLFGVLGLFILSLSLPGLGILKSDFFPKTDADTFAINFEAEPGTRLDITSELVKPIETLLLKEKEVTSFATTVGAQSGGGGKSLGGSNSGDNYASITINLIKKEYGRKETSIDMTDRLRKEFTKINGIKITIAEAASGPASGADFEIKIYGENFNIMQKIADDYKKVLSKIPGAINIESSRKPVPLEFKFSFDSTKLALYDLSLAQVGLFVRNVVDGAEATKILKGTDEIIVRTIYNNESSNNLDKIKDLKIKNLRGQDVFLRDILVNELNPSTNSITRINQKRVISVTASAGKTTNGKNILAEFNKKTASYKMPVGYEGVVGGSNEESAKSVASLMTSMIFGIFFIIITLVVLFDSYKQSILVLTTIPLSLIGVFVGLVLFGQPLSFPGLIGLVALFGIVVRNGIILFDKINANIKEDIEFKESIIDAVKTRLEPVFLTSICTVLGMIPLTLSNPTWTSLGLSIIFGLTVSTFFTLIVLPTLYFIFIKDKSKIIENGK